MNKKIMNQLVKIASNKQNDNLKLNAGQWREAINIIFSSLYEIDLSVMDTGKDFMKKTATKKVKKVATKKATPKKK